jgi:hypothetical protein
MKIAALLCFVLLCCALLSFALLCFALLHMDGNGWNAISFGCFLEHTVKMKPTLRQIPLRAHSVKMKQTLRKIGNYQYFKAFLEPYFSWKDEADSNNVIFSPAKWELNDMGRKFCYSTEEKEKKEEEEEKEEEEVLRRRKDGSKEILTVRRGNIIIKSGLTQQKMDNEEKILKLGLDYTPAFVSRNNTSITMTYIKAKDFKGQHGMYPTIQKIGERFRRDTGYHHGDLNCMNMLHDEAGKLYLIDFEKIYQPEQFLEVCCKENCGKRCYKNF